LGYHAVRHFLIIVFLFVDFGFFKFQMEGAGAGAGAVHGSDGEGHVVVSDEPESSIATSCKHFSVIILY
jgi:hypothetical protein